MIESQPIEQYWEESDQQQETQNKLYSLHSQNEVLRVSLEKAQTQIQTYLQRIAELHNKEIQASSENQQLVEKHTQLSQKYESMERTLNKRNDEYASLYNYLFVQPKRSFRELVMKQLELNNDLNQIQHESDSQLIDQLRGHLKQRHEQIYTLSQQINKLNDALLESTNSYQEMICKLKEDKIRLEYQIYGYEQEKESNQLHQNSNYESKDVDICNQMKQKSYQQELRICESEITSLRTELIEAKSRINGFQFQKRQRQMVSKTQKKQPVDFGFHEIQKIVNQNNLIKNQLRDLREKHQILVEGIPNFNNIQDQINQCLEIRNTNNQLTCEIQQIRKDNHLKEGNLKNLEIHIDELEKRQAQLEAKQQNSQTKTAKTFDKLKKIIGIYVPCFNLYGFSSLGLDEQQTKMVEDKSLGLQFELNRLSKQLNAKIIDLGARKSKIRQLQNQIQQQHQQINTHKEENKQLLQKVQKVSACLDLVGKQQQRIRNSQIKHIEEQEDFEIEAQSEGVIEIRQQPAICSESRVDILERAVQQLQNDRCELLAIVREKDLIISEVQAKVNKLSSNVNVYNFVEAANITLNQIQVSAPSLINESQFVDAQQLKQLRAQISVLNDQYQRQTDLVLKGQTKKYVDLQIKYNKLLEQYGSLQQSFLKLQKESDHKNSEIREEKRQQVIQMVEQSDNIQNIQNQDQNSDQNAISEFTIQTISDLLKKYQKQFNKFAILYDEKMTKSGTRKIFEEQSSEKQNNRLLNIKRQVSHLQGLLTHNIEIITILEAEISSKEESHRLEIANFEQRIQFDDQKINELTARLEQSKKAITDLQAHQIESMISEEKGGASEQSLSTAFIIINSKSKEITNLLSQNSKLSKLLKEQTQELDKINQRDNSLESPLSQKELLELKNLIEEENLPIILQSFLSQLQNSKQASQQ